jgi:peptide/nickel transport system ATP-binding protein
VQPEFIVADEPASALDVSIQAQVINLLADLKTRLGLALLFISHDITVMAHLCDRTRSCTSAASWKLDQAKRASAPPSIPTRRRCSGAVHPDPELRPERQLLEGGVPNPVNPPAGCVFRPGTVSPLQRAQARCPRFAKLRLAASRHACVTTFPKLIRDGLASRP